MRITIADVAREAGVSKATVSRVLNGLPTVTPEIRLKVEHAIEKLGYYPQATARNLSRSRTNTIGVILRPGRRLFVNAFYSAVLSGVAEKLSERGLLLLLAGGDSQENYRVFLEMVRGEAVDGLIVAGKLQKSTFDELKSVKIPVVLIHDYHESFDSITVDNVKGSTNAINYLVDKGHKRIALITGPMNEINSIERFHGAMEAAEARGVKIESHMIAEGDWKMLGGYETMRVLLARSRPSAVFSFCDDMAFGAIRMIRESGLDVPGDVSVIGFDDVEHTTSLPVPLTSVRIFKEEMGNVAVEVLLQRMNEYDGPPRRIILDVALKERESVLDIS